MRYKIPRNIKVGLSFMGLQLIGWLLFLPSAGMSVLLAFLAFKFLTPQAGVMIGLIGVGLFYYCYQVDEKSGTMNISWLFERIRWSRGPKIIEPVWGEEYGKFGSLNIKSVSQKGKRDPETRNSD